MGVNTPPTFVGCDPRLTAPEYPLVGWTPKSPAPDTLGGACDARRSTGQRLHSADELLNQLEEMGIERTIGACPRTQAEGSVR